MKKLMLVLMCLFLLTSVSALNFDNVKDYDKKTNTVTIKNAFGLGNDISKIKLNTPIVNYVLRGEDRLVAEFTIDNFDDYSNAFNDMEFYDIKDNMKKFDREFTYKYKVVNTKAKWKEFNEKVKLPKGKITLGIFTDVYANERVEWIPTLFGVEINEWAVWTEGLNVGLVAGWNMNGDPTNVTNIIDVFTSSANGTLTGVDFVEGLLGNATNFVEDADKIDITDPVVDLGTTTDMTFSLWVNWTSGDNIMGKGLNDNHHYTITENSGQAKFRMYRYSPGFDVSVTGGTILNNGVYNHIVGQFNRDIGNVSLWVDGVYAGSTVNANTNDTNLSVGDLHFGANAYGSALAFDGDLDEVYLWNRLLSSLEIEQLYNSGNGISYNVIPKINIAYPLNTTYITNITELNYTVVRGTADSCWYSLDGGATNSSRQDWGLNWTGLSSSEGNNTWIVYCNNTLGYVGKGNITFTTDTTYPTVDITFPLNTVNYYSAGENETLNWTIFDINLDACWYDYNNTNITVTCNDNNTLFLLVRDWYNVTLWANDTFGNMNSSFFEWGCKIFQNSKAYNSSTYETATETFTINVTANSSLTAASLIHNGISHVGTKSGTTYSTTFDIPNSVGNKTFYWDFTYAGTHINSTVHNQTVNNTLLGLCNATLTVPYINFTFVDEESLININATIDTSTWIYYLGSGTVTKTLIYSNVTPHDNYAFCLSASNDTMHNTRSIQYASPGYPQRKHDASSDLTNATTNKTLYLLSSTDGIYTTIQVVDTQSNRVGGVEVTAERQFSGVWTVIGQETTDGAGAVTFWVNPDYDHRFTFVSDDCTGTTTTVRPTQTQYTQELVCGITVDYVAIIEGIKYARTPKGGIVQPGVYNFTYTLVSAKSNIINASFYIVNASSGTVLNSSVSACTAGGCTLFFTYNITKGEDIKGRYYVDLGNGSILLEGDAWWKCIHISTSGKGGVKTLFKDIIYLFQEWGDDSSTADFNRLVAIFFIMCVSISVLNYHFKIDTMNPGAFLVGFTLFVLIGSIVGGTDSQGLFYFNNLKTTGSDAVQQFVNNYLLVFICFVITVSYFFNVNRQAQR